MRDDLWEEEAAEGVRRGREKGGERLSKLMIYDLLRPHALCWTAAYLLSFFRIHRDEEGTEKKVFFSPGDASSRLVLSDFVDRQE